MSARLTARGELVAYAVALGAMWLVLLGAWFLGGAR